MNDHADPAGDRHRRRRAGPLDQVVKLVTEPGDERALDDQGDGVHRQRLLEQVVPGQVLDFRTGEVGELLVRDGVAQVAGDHEPALEALRLQGDAQPVRPFQL